MDSKNVILWPVIISVIGHVALISASSMIDLRDSGKPAEIFNVDIKEQLPELSPPKGGNQKNTAAAKAKAINGSTGREATVNLNSSDLKYAAYLIKIRNKILQIWEYPQTAYERNEEGVAIVKISLDADGKLAATALMSSSGSKVLDEGALGIVKAAAPFEPLPGSYSLSRLHIIASFHYKLVE